jgi:hypothetical protein
MPLLVRRRPPVGTFWRSLALALAAGCASAPHGTTLASGRFPWGIAVDGQYVYWVNADSGQSSIMRVPKGGGTPITIASSQLNAVAVAVDSSAVYWANAGTSTCAPSGACTSNGDGAVLRAPLTGGAPTTLASGQHVPVSIAVDSTNAYFIDEGTAVYDSSIADGSVVKVPLGGGAPVTLATGYSYPGALAIDKANVYWTAPDSLGKGTVFKVPIAGGTIVTLATGFWAWDIQTGGSTVPTLIATDGNDVYWVTANVDGAGAKVMKVAVSGGLATELGSFQGQLSTLALDSAALYWTDERSFVKVLLAGGSPTTFDTGEGTPDPGGLVVDSTNLYWTDHLGGAVMSASK